MGVGRILRGIALGTFLLAFVLSGLPIAGALTYVFTQQDPITIVVNHDVSQEGYADLCPCCITKMKSERDSLLLDGRVKREEYAFAEKQKRRNFEIRTKYKVFKETDDFEAYWDYYNKPRVSSQSIEEYFKDRCGGEFKGVLKYNSICSNYN